MFQILMRFYEELNDFLPPTRRKVEFPLILNGKTSVKNVIESLGVPHTEIDLILVNQVSVDFSYIIHPHDRISVYPVFEAFDIAPIIQLRKKPLRKNRFVLDVHLGRLAVYLRFSGFDTFYRNNYTDEELAHISATEPRILLTRDRNLLKRSIVTHGYYVRETSPKRQVIEVFQRFQLGLASPLQQRCTRCNALLRTIPKEQIVDRLLPGTRASYQDFSYCQTCDKIYWKGAHYQNMIKCLEKIAN